MVTCRALVLVLFSVYALGQATPAPPALQEASGSGPTRHESNFEEERAQADQLYLAHKTLEALPLYEDLCRQDGTVALFAERYAAGLFAKASATSDPKQKQEIAGAGIRELERAELLGDHSLYVEGVLNSIAKSPASMLSNGRAGVLPLTVGYTYSGNDVARPMLQQGQVAAAHADLPAALELYLSAAQADPRWYMAALSTGEAYMRLKDYANAEVWFAKAIALDPDRETAYRFCGDALLRAGNANGAKHRYEEAIAAEPYGRLAFLGLEQWAVQTHTMLTPPTVRRPQLDTKDGHLADTALTTGNGTGVSSWLVYRKARLAHGENVILNQWIMAGSTPDSVDFHFVPSGYVHSLSEEGDALHAMLMDVYRLIARGELSEPKLDRGLRTLLQVQKENMLEPFILLNFNDAGLRHGYPEYRAGHREQVAAYIDRFYIGPPNSPEATNPYVQGQP